MSASFLTWTGSNPRPSSPDLKRPRRRRAGRRAMRATPTRSPASVEPGAAASQEPVVVQRGTRRPALRFVDELDRRQRSVSRERQAEPPVQPAAPRARIPSAMSNGGDRETPAQPYSRRQRQRWSRQSREGELSSRQWQRLPPRARGRPVQLRLLASRGIGTRVEAGRATGTTEGETARPGPAL